MALLYYRQAEAILQNFSYKNNKDYSKTMLNIGFS